MNEFKRIRTNFRKYHYYVGESMQLEKINDFDIFMPIH